MLQNMEYIHIYIIYTIVCAEMAAFCLECYRFRLHGFSRTLQKSNAIEQAVYNSYQCLDLSRGPWVLHQSW